METRERFTLTVPLYGAPLSKSQAAPAEDIPEELREWVFYGIASTEDRDIQGEVVVQKGIDFRPFLASGYFNWNHSHNPEDQVAAPLRAEITDGPALFIQGVLYPHVERARAIRDLMRSMSEVTEAGGPVRKLGLSVEGEKIVLDGYRIEKCVIDMIAFTHEPVNPFTWTDLVKSMTKSLVGFPMSSAMTTSDTALLNQNLDAGVTDLIWGECHEGHYNPSTKRFRGGVQGALNHMISCRGYEPQAAANILKLIYHGIYA